MCGRRDILIIYFDQHFDQRHFDPHRPGASGAPGASCIAPDILISISIAPDASRLMLISAPDADQHQAGAFVSIELSRCPSN